MDRYADTGINWRVVEGLGATIARYGANLPVMLDCPVHAFDHRGKRLRVETSNGVIEADQVIVALPAALIAAERVVVHACAAAKVDAARKLPLGVNDKLFMSLDNADEFDVGTRLFGHTDRVGDGGLSRAAVRPSAHRGLFRRPAARPNWKANGDSAFFDFAASELVRLASAAISEAA